MNDILNTLRRILRRIYSVFAFRGQKLRDLKLAKIIIERIQARIDSGEIASIQQAKPQFVILGRIIDDENVIAEAPFSIFGSRFNPPEANDLKFAVADLKRFVDVRLDDLGHPSEAQAAGGHGQPDILTPSYDTDSPMLTSKSDDGAILWSISEKLYASWQIRAIVVVLGVAIAIATGGAFVIGGQTLNVRKDIDTASDRARGEIKTASEGANRQFKEMSDALIKQLGDRGRDVDEQMNKAEAQAKSLQARGDEIKTDIVKKLQDDLSSQATGVTNKILRALTEIQDKDIAAISARLPSLRNALDRIDQEITNRSAQLTAVGPKLNQLKIYGDEADKIDRALSTIRTDEDAAHKSAREAKSQQDAAAAAAKLAAEDRQRTADSLKAADDEMIKRNRTLAEIELRISNLDSMIAAEQKHLEAVRDHIKTLENSAQQIPPKLLPPAAPSSRSDADLTVDDWRKIQRALARQGYSIGRIDGKRGTRTANAIREYQANSKTPVTGWLTPQQINDLLK